MSTIQEISRERRPKNKLPCEFIAGNIHRHIMFCMKRLTQYNSDINHVIVNIDAMLTELELLKLEVIDKLSLYTFITEQYMLENYANCEQTSLTIIPQVMGTFKQLFDEFKTELFRIKHNYYSNRNNSVAIAELQTLISQFLNNLPNLDEFLRIITNMNYEDYLKRPDEDTRRSLWGGRRSKGWRRKTKRRRNNKTKRRRNKSMRLH